MTKRNKALQFYLKRIARGIDMHEFALAENIIKTICQKVVADLQTVSAIYIEVGVFSGVVNESLELGLKIIREEKKAGPIDIHINVVPTQVKCECDHEYQINDIYSSCPVCHSPNRTILSGADVIIQSVDLREDSASNGSGSKQMEGGKK